jgi:outer membrane protein assembly factor BamB
MKENIHLPLKERWSITLPNGIPDSPIFAGGAIFVICPDRLYKINPSDGNILWEMTPDSPTHRSPAYHEGKVFFSSHLRGSNLYCVDSKSGKEIRRINTGTYGDSCCISENSLFLHCKRSFEGRKVYGYASFTVDDLEEKWFHESEAAILMSTCAVSNGILVYGDSAGNLYGLEAAKGREIWKMKIGDWIRNENKGADSVSDDILYASEAPVVVGDVVIVSARTPGQTLGLDLKSGKVMWSYQADEDESWMYRGLGFGETRWYSLTMNKLNPRHYFAIDIGTGKVEMKADVRSYKAKIGDVMAKNGLVVGNYHFIGVYEPPRIIAFDTGTGELVWTYPIDKSKLRGDSRGIYADGKLIWVRNTGDVYCFE